MDVHRDGTEGRYASSHPEAIRLGPVPGSYHDIHVKRRKRPCILRQQSLHEDRQVQTNTQSDSFSQRYDTEEQEGDDAYQGTFSS